MLSEKEKLLKAKAKAKEKEKKMKAKEKEKKAKEKEKEKKAKAKPRSVGGNMFSSLLPLSSVRGNIAEPDTKNKIIQKILTKMKTIPTTFQFINDITKDMCEIIRTNSSIPTTLDGNKNIDNDKNYLRLYEYCKTIQLFIENNKLYDNIIIKTNLEKIDAYELTIVYNNMIKHGNLYSAMINKIVTENPQFLRLTVETPSE